MLQDLVHQYNNTKHRTIRLKPSQVNRNNAKKLLQTAFSHINIIDSKHPKFKLHDYVRISKYREAFRKGYVPSWNQNGQEIQGAFYTEELQNAKYKDIYLVEKILRKKANMVLVKWLGLDSSRNSWASKLDLTDTSYLKGDNYAPPTAF
ncbi:uncharacterized protein LOC108912512 [Anoplophora glabripennis]|uniref:uncharacterized protein LOC108912512 n=1 Tax=Anoplophora glabripennis TaxID=217634 RepID=UPI0008756AA6|nr:uncharacterized protein LOC108912512 [Anoplophora glabripennis]